LSLLLGFLPALVLRASDRQEALSVSQEFLKASGAVFSPSTLSVPNSVSRILFDYRFENIFLSLASKPDTY
jgi:hypothetical protein